MDNKIIDKINMFINKYQDKCIALYGIGDHTEKILKKMDKPQKIYCLIDRKNNIKSKYDLPVYSIEEIKDKVEVIVISSFQFQYFISERLEKYKNKIKILNLYEPEDYLIVSEVSYKECHENWEREDVDTHGFTDMDSFKEVYSYLKRVMNFSKSDIVLDIGCGDGKIDYFLKNDVKKVFAYDFSHNKLQKARKLNPSCIYNQNSFLEYYNYKKANKAFSFSVMQYCKPCDLEVFLLNSIDEIQDNGLVAHFDVPDKSKCHKYYKEAVNLCENIIEEYYDKIHLIWNDGSYWVNMENVKEICQRNNIVCEIIDSNCAYRSDIILRRKN